MAKRIPLIKLQLPIYEMDELNRILDAARSLDTDGTELLRIALNEYMHNHGM